MSKSRHVVASVSDVAPGTSKRVNVAGRDVALFNIGGAFFALANKCPHESGSLCEGKIIGLAMADEPGRYKLLRDGEFVKCSWHGWEFDIRTGQSWCDPSNTRVRAYDTAVETGEALVKGPYVAETFPVVIEQDYVIIEV